MSRPRYVVRDFAQPHGGGYAVIHLPHCSTITRQLAADQARRAGNDWSGSDHTYTHFDVADVAAAHRRLFTVEVPMRWGRCVEVEQQALVKLSTIPELAERLGVGMGRVAELVYDLEERLDHSVPLTVNATRGGQPLLRADVADVVRAVFSLATTEQSSAPTSGAATRIADEGTMP